MTTGQQIPTNSSPAADETVKHKRTARARVCWDIWRVLPHVRTARRDFVTGEHNHATRNQPLPCESSPKTIVFCFSKKRTIVFCFQIRWHVRILHVIKICTVKGLRRIFARANLSATFLFSWHIWNGPLLNLKRGKNTTKSKLVFPNLMPRVTRRRWAERQGHAKRNKDQRTPSTHMLGKSRRGHARLEEDVH
jgi:hypothetical protein